MYSHLLRCLTLLGLLLVACADETSFRLLEKRSKALQLRDLRNLEGSCRPENVAVRREWSRLSSRERKAYISAVKCIRRKRSITYPDVPGARNLFDDFQAVHINQTLSIHFDVLFFPWHRYFTWAYERALREECNYKGYQPYWEWSAFALDPEASPLFDGSATSISGNGEKINLGNVTSNLPPSLNRSRVFPPQNGGGCLTNGPFTNLNVNLGPVPPNVSLSGFFGSGIGFDYNPRCLTRDLGPGYSKLLDWNATTTLLSSPDSFANFQGLVEKTVHNGGHSTIGGLNHDFFASPGDPAFYFHHAQIDRMWTLWQNLDIKKRRLELQGTSTIFNTPPSANVTLRYPTNLGPIAPSVEIGTLMSTFDGLFCYRYE